MTAPASTTLLIGILALGASTQSLPAEVASASKIGANSVPTLAPALEDDDWFGSGVAVIGDVDGDGLDDLAVGARGDDDGGANKGAVYVLFMGEGATVADVRKISASSGGLAPAPADGAWFGWSVAALGDVDGDGVGDLAVGAVFDDVGDGPTGCVRVLLLAPDGSVKGARTIASGLGGFTGTLSPFGKFGASVAGLGDVDGDGVPDLAVGSVLDGDGGPNRGAVWVLRLLPDGSVKAQQKISSTEGGFLGKLDDFDEFGTSLVSIGDLGGDGVPDLAVGAVGDDDSGADRGAVWILHLAADGTVLQHRKLSGTQGGFTGALGNEDSFGQSLALVDDLNGDARPELVVGTFLDDDGTKDTGAIWVLFLDALGGVVNQRKISKTAGGLSATLQADDWFGWSLAALGDVDGDGAADVVVGAVLDDDAGDPQSPGLDRGALHVLHLHDHWRELGGSLAGSTPPSLSGDEVIGDLPAQLTAGEAPDGVGDDVSPGPAVPGPSRGDGVPDLEGSGLFVPGEIVTLALADAKPGAFTVLFGGLQQIDMTFKGGTMVPSPELVRVSTVDAAGTATTTFPWVPNLPSDVVITFQHWVVDAAGPKGFSASNAVALTLP